ncbi:PWWP domain-containing protein 2A isoform X2 [Engystomops pustulosus]|uniref:PWWP domain-containing protein 2A isoform X2 n=1 Tax=Engystomops pustulosus TaxID=76066 RepID=UPI003AFA24E4
MAAAAGAPGSGEGGEAEPDSEPISGDDRPRHEECEAAALRGGVVEELGWEGALHTEEAGREVTGLRLPETECIGPEVTDWESDAEGPSAALEASPGAWRAEGVDTMEPMQMGDLPEALEEFGVPPFEPECPRDPHRPDSFTQTPSPQPQVTSESIQAPDPPEEVHVLQESIPDMKDLHVQANDPMSPLTLTAAEQNDVQDQHPDPVPKLPIFDKDVPDAVPDLSTLGEASSAVLDLSTLGEASSAVPDLSTLGEASSAVPDLSTLGEASSPVPDLSTLGEEVSSPAPDLSTLGEEVSSPAPNLSTLGEEVSSPAPNLSTLGEEVSSPAPDLSTLGEEVSSPAPDLSTLGEEVSSPAPDLSTLGEEVSSPAPDLSTLGEEVSSPAPDLSTLGEEVSSPAPDLSTLGEEVSSPAPDLSTLGEEVSSPAPDLSTLGEEVSSPAPDLSTLGEMSEPSVPNPVPELSMLDVTSNPVPDLSTLGKASEPLVPNPVPNLSILGETSNPVPDLPTLAEAPDPGVAILVPDVSVLGQVYEMDDPITPDEDQETEMMLENIPCTVDEVTAEEVTDSDSNSAPEPCEESIDAEIQDVHEAFHKEDVDEEEEQIVDDYPEPMPCTEVGLEVKLFLQPDHVSLEKECPLEKSPGQASVQLIMSETVPEDVRSPSEEAVSPMDSGISSELTSVDKELDSQSGPTETEPNVESSSDCAKFVSYSEDVDYDPFYRDTKTEDSSKSEADVQEDDAAMAAPTDIVQTDQCPQEAHIHAACKDNPDPSPDPLRLVTGGIDDLIPGSEVQVTLDHIIQDALVVSFRHGDRIFSGVLMDLSKRFGPHGIPVTVHPKREYKNKPEEPVAQPESTSFHEEESLKNENATAPMDNAPIQPTEPCAVTNNLWTSKPPPLFHEGAPYPPPLFIRDTYNQSIPQPPPRKIKRLKKKIYREEPTSIMNAIKLRPRQVLCDKCKNVVTDKREVRKTGGDSFKLEEGKRRRHESVTTVNKKLKTDHKVNGKSQSESHKKNPVSGRGKVVKVAPQANAPKAQLHTKKVLQSKNMDHAKAREVLKLAKEKAQKKQKDTSSSKNAHRKVHFTRRLQNTTSGTLPPRLRIKPQRYRNEENDSSLKIGLESLRSSKPQTRYTATRSAGEAPSEIKTPTDGPEEVSSAIENPSVCVPPANTH